MKYLLGLALGLLLLSASVAKADGFNPGDVSPGEIVFDFSLDSINVLWLVEVLDTAPQGADFWGFCITPEAPGPSPFCPHEGPIQVFEPAGSTFDIATDVFGFDPALNPPTISTPEPSTGGLLVAGCFLCAFVALRRRMA